VRFEISTGTQMTRKDLLAGGVGGLAAAALLLGGQLALADTTHPVNTPVAPGQVAPPSFADIVQRVAPAVVSIDVEGKAQPQETAFAGPHGGGEEDPFGNLPPEFRHFFQFGPSGPSHPMPLRATGSGFFVSPDGYIVTNNHVVEGADKITVRTNDDRELKATLVGRDPATDLAVVKVQGSGYPFVSFEDRAKPRVGDWVVAVGNPFNLGGTATAGIVSALARPQISGSGYVDYMQIDAPINRGNSGGPSFDLYGRVVGVNSAIFSPSGGSVGIGFDIPADVAAQVTKQLIAHGKVTRGYIGATVQDITPDIAESLGVKAHSGALVADVTADGPSAQAGLKSGDLVLSVDGQPITSASDLTRKVGLAHPGDAIHLQVRRDGRPQELTVRSGLRPSERQLAENDLSPATPGGGAHAGSLGLMVAPNKGGGLTVEEVSPTSDAAQKGVRPGDVIEQVAGKRVNTAAEVHAAVAAAKAKGHKDVLVRVAHGGQRLYLPLAIGSNNG
jgi:serine protease Do